MEDGHKCPVCRCIFGSFSDEQFLAHFTACAERKRKEITVELHHRFHNYQFCPFCAKKLSLEDTPKDVTDHLLNCQRDRVADTHPEVGEGAESEDELYPPEDIPHQSPK